MAAARAASSLAAFRIAPVEENKRKRAPQSHSRDAAAPGDSLQEKSRHRAGDAPRAGIAARRVAASAPLRTHATQPSMRERRASWLIACASGGAPAEEVLVVATLKTSCGRAGACGWGERAACTAHLRERGVLRGWRGPPQAFLSVCLFFRPPPGASAEPPRASRALRCIPPQILTARRGTRGRARKWTQSSGLPAREQNPKSRNFGPDDGAAAFSESTPEECSSSAQLRVLACPCRGLASRCANGLGISSWLQWTRGMTSLSDTQARGRVSVGPVRAAAVPSQVSRVTWAAETRAQGADRRFSLSAVQDSQAGWRPRAREGELSVPCVF